MEKNTKQDIYDKILIFGSLAMIFYSIYAMFTTSDSINQYIGFILLSLITLPLGLFSYGLRSYSNKRIEDEKARKLQEEKDNA